MQCLFLESSEPKNCALAGYYAASSGISYRRFGATYQFHPQSSRIQKDLDSSTLRMRLKGCPKMWVRNYH